MSHEAMEPPPVGNSTTTLTTMKWFSLGLNSVNSTKTARVAASIHGKSSLLRSLLILALTSAAAILFGPEIGGSSYT